MEKEKVAKVSFGEIVAVKFKRIKANSGAIEAKKAHHGEVISTLDGAKAMKVQLEQEVEQHKVDRTDAGAVILEATG